jgi:hypothetical protein
VQYPFLALILTASNDNVDAGMWQNFFLWDITPYSPCPLTLKQCHSMKEVTRRALLTASFKLVFCVAYSSTHEDGSNTFLRNVDRLMNGTLRIISHKTELIIIIAQITIYDL